MNLARWRFPVEDLDAYERRYRLRVRLVAVSSACLAAMFMFDDRRVGVAAGAAALGTGAIVGLLGGAVENRLSHEVRDWRSRTRWAPPVYLGGVFAVWGLVHILWGSRTVGLVGGGGWMAVACGFFMRAPAVARYRRQRYEEDLAELR